MAAIFDLPLIHTSGSLRRSLVVLPDPENMGPAVGILLLSCKQAEICVYHIYFRLQATIFGFSQIHTSGNLRSSLVVYPDSENMGIAVRIFRCYCV